MNLKDNVLLKLFHKSFSFVLFLIQEDEILILVLLESSHCLIQDLQLYNFDLFEAKKKIY
jgi:hypothetical protein